MSKLFSSKMKQKQQEGYTLIELLLVIALIAISVGVTSDVLLSLIRSYGKTAVINEVEQQSNFVGLKIEKELRNSTNVAVGNNGNQLSFDYDGGTVYYNIANNNIFRSTGAFSTSNSDALVATPSLNGTVGGVIVACDGTCVSLSGSNPQVVNLSIVFSEASGGGVAYKGQINLKNTIVIRNTY